MRAVVAFVLVVPVALAASRFSGVFPYSHHRPFLSGGVVVGVLQRKNCYIFSSCSRRYGKG